MQLKGARILVTGATGGLGSATAAELIRQQANPILSGRNLARLQQLAQGLTQNGRVPEIVVADWSNAAGRAALIARVNDAQKPVSGVVLNAGVNRFGAFEAQSPAQLMEVLQTDLMAPALLAHGMLPALKRRPDSTLMFVGSSFARLGHPGFASYCAAKHGLHGLAKALRRETMHSGLRVLELHPRAMQTGMSTADIDAVNRLQNAAVDQPQAIAQQLVQSLAKGRIHWQAGWPERLFILLDQRLPSLLDRVLGGRWPQLKDAADQALIGSDDQPAISTPNLS